MPLRCMAMSGISPAAGRLCMTRLWRFVTKSDSFRKFARCWPRASAVKAARNHRKNWSWPSGKSFRASFPRATIPHIFQPTPGFCRASIRAGFEAKEHFGQRPVRVVIKINGFFRERGIQVQPGAQIVCGRGFLGGGLQRVGILFAAGGSGRHGRGGGAQLLLEAVAVFAFQKFAAFALALVFVFPFFALAFGVKFLVVVFVNLVHVPLVAPEAVHNEQQFPRMARGGEKFTEALGDFRQAVNVLGPADGDHVMAGMHTMFVKMTAAVAEQPVDRKSTRLKSSQ